MTYSHDQFIGIYENAMSEDWCDQVINLFESQNKIHQTRYDKQNLQNHEISDTSCGLFDLNLKYCNFFEQTLFQNILPLYEKQYGIISRMRGSLFLDDFKIQKTNLTEGYHIWHYEHGPLDFQLSRVLVYTLYLNDIDEGGETEFLYQSKRVPPKKGLICLFPAGFTHTHRGNPPLSNPKYIMTGWLSYKTQQIQEHE